MKLKHKTHIEEGELNERLKNWFEIYLQNVLFSVVLVNVKIGFPKKETDRKTGRKESLDCIRCESYLLQSPEKIYIRSQQL